MYLKGVPQAMKLFQHPFTSVFFPVYFKKYLARCWAGGEDAGIK